MKKLLIACGAVFFCTSVVGCGAVIFGANNSTDNDNNVQSEQPATEASQAPQAAAATEAAASMDCDDFMKGLSDSCFSVMAFEADGKTPLRMKDDAGNDLGEVDQAWVASYCECYAQTAFQKFGCSAVMADESLDDATYSTKYAPVVDACSSIDSPANTTATDAAAVGTDAAAVGTDAAAVGTDAAAVGTDAAAVGTDAVVPVN